MGLLSRAITVNPPGLRPGQAAQVFAGTEAVRNALRNYWLQNSSFQGIVLELPEHAGGAGFKTFFAAVSSMVASIGRALPLSSKNVLFLFSKDLDRELLTHRLVKTLRTRALVSFEADSPGEAFSWIQSCL
ncbi:MAG: hypothetical protein LBH57_09655 [Treponema sp.]|jgi:hypothetical protein|nr:hypothetical protein [Treponema sp.]